MALIYLDHAATTATDPRVLEEMLPYYKEQFGNPSSAYTFSQQVRRSIDRAREQIAAAVHASSGEIYFTSGGTESDNWALTSAYAYGAAAGKNHIIVSAIEHPAVLNTAKFLEGLGARVTILPVGKTGRIDIEELRSAICKDTVLVSIMTANNEIGTIEPVAQIGALCREKGVLFHTDAVQAIGQMQIDVEEMQIDLLSASAHKFGGPKGIGFLYINRSLALPALLHGGSQERNRRAGTENTPAIIGMAKALELAQSNLADKQKQLLTLRSYLEQSLKEAFPTCRINGDPDHKLPNNVNVTFPGNAAELMMIRLDRKGICVSAGSACASGSLDPSHVLTAIGLGIDEARSTLRLTLGTENTTAQLDTVIQELKEIIR